MTHRVIQLRDRQPRPEPPKPAPAQKQWHEMTALEMEQWFRENTERLMGRPMEEDE